MPTILYCNPNAECFEYLSWTSEWIDFYLNNSINLFLWNYWGYGRSQGSPSPRDLLNDGEDVLEYLKETKGCLKIGVHGQSLGGAVACHLSKIKGVDIIIADWTFGSLTDMVGYLYGPYL